MDGDILVELARRTLEAGLFVAAPLLLIATLVSLIVSILQVLTSLQDTTLSTVPRLAAVAGGIFLLTPWMVHRLARFTIALLSDFRPYLH
jgi:flagellar biosynthetic protein FliQ